MPRTLFLISASSWKSDSRLRRFARIGQRAEFDTHVFAHLPAEPDSAHELHLSDAPRSSFTHRVVDVLTMALCSLLPARAMLAVMARRNVCRTISAGLLAHRIAPDAVICAKHWVVLPAALLACRRSGARLWLDVNEVFEAEHADRRLWRLVYPPVIRRLMRMAQAQQALFTITSQAQIARRGPQGAVYVPNLKQPAPAAPGRCVGTPLRLLYHGLILPNRGLDVVLDALAASGREDLQLTIRGYGKPALLEALQAQSARLGLTERVHFEDGVPNAEVVARAAQSDIGLCVFSRTTEQILCSEPNKLYEYLAAGLGIIATRTPGMQSVLDAQEYGAQIPFDAEQRAHLADVFRTLQADRVQAWQERARLFAAEQPARLERKDADLEKLLRRPAAGA